MCRPRRVGNVPGYGVNDTAGGVVLGPGLRDQPGDLLLIFLSVILRSCGAALKLPGKCIQASVGGANLRLEGSQSLAGVRCRISPMNFDDQIYVVMYQK